MKRVVLYVCAAAAAITPWSLRAQPAKAEKIRCQGSYRDFTQQNKDAEYDRVILEIAGNKVRVTGAPQFAAVYTIWRQTEDRVSFEMPSNQAIVGVFNRKDHRLTIANRHGENVRQLLMGTKCTAA